MDGRFRRQRVLRQSINYHQVFRIFWWRGRFRNISYVHLILKISYMKLFVAGLPYDLYDDELMEIFEKFGTIASAKVTMDKETGKSRGFGFVDMPNDEEAREAIEHLNDISLGKKPLVVKQADERGAGSGGGGGFRGGQSGGGGFNRRDNNTNRGGRRY